MNEILEHRKRVQENILKSFGVEISSNDIEKSEIDDIEKAHNPGDIHPNGKWEWRKTPTGYDWRVIKKDKKHSESQGSGDSEEKNEKSKNEFINSFKEARTEVLNKIIDGSIQATDREKQLAKKIINDRKKVNHVDVSKLTANEKQMIDKVVDRGYKILNSKYNDKDKMSLKKTPQGNWRCYYDGKDIGSTISGDIITDVVAKKIGWADNENNLDSYASKTSTENLKKVASSNISKRVSKGMKEAAKKELEKRGIDIEKEIKDKEEKERKEVEEREIKQKERDKIQEKRNLRKEMNINRRKYSDIIERTKKESEERASKEKSKAEDKKESSPESKSADSLVNKMTNNDSLGNEFYDYTRWDDEAEISEKRLNEFRNLEKHYSWRGGKSFDGHVEESKVKEYVNKQKEKGLIAVNVDSGSDYSFYLFKKLNNEK